MINFEIINPGDNPNEGRNKINYNFSLITGSTSGGTTNPGGSNQDIQFNDSNVFGGISDFTFDKTNCNLQMGCQNTSNSSINSLIVGGFCNTLYNSHSVSIIGGKDNYMSTTVNYSSIIGGFRNKIYENSSKSFIAGGSNNTLEYLSYSSTIIGGCSNIGYQVAKNSSIIGGKSNTLFLTNSSSIVGGSCNCVYNSYCSSIIGGKGNTVCVSHMSAIIGGTNLTLSNQCNTVFVPNLQINSNVFINSGGTFSSGITGTYSIGANTFTIIGGIITKIT